MVRLLSICVLLAAALLAACGGSDAELPPAAKQRPRSRIVEPQVIEQAQPDLTEDEAEALWATPGTVRAVVRVAINREGVASGARVVSAEPKDLPIAHAFAEAVVRSIPHWRFRPATRDGQPVDAEMNLTMEAEPDEEPPPKP